VLDRGGRGAGERERIVSSAENEPLALWARVRSASAALQELSVEERVQAIASACAALREPDAELLRVLSASSGLSEPMARWALETTFGAFDEDALRALAQKAQPHARGVAAVLAGNVLTAAARPMLLPLLVGVPVFAKASSRDDVLPHAIARAVSAAHPMMGMACAVATFGHGDIARLDALLAGADCVQVLGSDEAVASVRERLRSDQTLVGRGHGLGLGVVLAASDLERAASAFARDVAAYDQRGCLSPHAIMVEGDDARAEAFAKALHEALGRELPRGVVPADAAAEQLQWRGVAAARGVLHVGDSWAVSCEHGASLRPSPGYRNVGVYTLASASALARRVAPFARFLKSLGVAGAASELPELAPYICDAGSMQTPPLGAPLDGLRPLTGFA
jgi:acyl-CoA reductase-like NAD-dependent aldehyde dehydrogenase